VAEEKIRSLSYASIDGARWLVVSEMELQEQFKKLSFLWAWGAELCLTIVGPSQVRSPLSVRMWVAALLHAGVVGELTVLRAIVSTVVELVLGHSPDETSRMEVMNEPTAKFWWLEELCSRLDGLGVRIHGLLLEPPPDQAQWADHLDKAAEQLEAELAERHQVDAELDILLCCTCSGPGTVRCRRSIFTGNIAVESRIDAATANGVRWGTQSTLVTILSHFPELKSELELLGARRNADMFDNQADALWPLVSVASDSLASLVPSSFACDPPDGVGG
jgi:hypothetical protein